MSTYADYRYRFPLAGLLLAAEAFTALRLVGVLPPDGLPDNMLGEPVLLNGAVITAGRAGRAALEYTDPDTEQLVQLPAAGDPAFVYVHIRSLVQPEQLPAGFDPAAFGLVATSPDESAAVLGVWA
jgi:hypothetical protein